MSMPRRFPIGRGLGPHNSAGVVGRASGIGAAATENGENNLKQNLLDARSLEQKLTGNEPDAKAILPELRSVKKGSSTMRSSERLDYAADSLVALGSASVSLGRQEATC